MGNAGAALLLHGRERLVASTAAVRVVLAVLAGIVLGLLGSAQPAAAADGPQTASLGCLGFSQYFNVPPGVTQLTLHLAGAAGADGGGGDGSPGKGATLNATLTVVPGHTLRIDVGCRNGYGFARGGGGGDNSVTSSRGLNGGGATGVYDGTANQVLLVAGGGGGGGGAGGITPAFQGGGNGGDGASSGGGGGSGLNAGSGGVLGASPSADGESGHFGTCDGGGGGGGGGGWPDGGGGGGGGHFGEGVCIGGGGGGGGGGLNYWDDAAASGVTGDIAASAADGSVSIDYTGPDGTPRVFNCTDSAGTYVVPAGVSSVLVTAVGAGGAKLATYDAVGGTAAGRTGKIAVAPGETISLGVGCHGLPGQRNDSFGATFAPGGAGGFGFSKGGGGGESNFPALLASDYGGCGGGGSTGIARSTTALLVAAGGGGCGGTGGYGVGGRGGDADADNASGGTGIGAGGPGHLAAGPNPDGNQGNGALQGELAGGGGGGGGGYPTAAARATAAASAAAVVAAAGAAAPSPAAPACQTGRRSTALLDQLGRRPHHHPGVGQDAHHDDGDGAREGQVTREANTASAVTVDSAGNVIANPTVTYAPGPGAPVNAGTYTASASYPGDDTHRRARTASTFTIAQAPSRTTVTRAQAVYDGQPARRARRTAPAPAGSTRPLTVTYRAAPARPTARARRPPTNAGDYTASASYAGDANHTGSTDSADYRITKAASTTKVTVERRVVRRQPARRHGQGHRRGRARPDADGDLQRPRRHQLRAEHDGRRRTPGDYTASASYAGDANHDRQPRQRRLLHREGAADDHGRTTRHSSTATRCRR